MKTKIGLPFGLALVMFLGVFTTMLALGAFNPQPAGADVAMAPMVTATEHAAYGFADWTITLTNDSTEIQEAADVDIVFGDADVGADEPANPVRDAANWKIEVLDSSDMVTAEVDVASVTSTEASDEVTINFASAVTADPTADPPVVAQPNNVPAGTKFRIIFTAPKSSGFPTGGIRNAMSAGTDMTVEVSAPSSATAQTAIGTNIITTVDRPANVTVNNDPDDPGHVGAGYRIDFYANTELTANLDKIIVRFDKDIGDPPSISRTAVLITADMVTPDDLTGEAAQNNGISGQATPLSSAPTHGLVNSLGSLDSDGDLEQLGDRNIAEYKLTLPDLDARPEVVAGIKAGAHVTVNFGPGAGLKNPTEAGKGDRVSVGLSTQETFASDNIVVPLVLEIDDVADKRDTPITITGKGFKNGTTATIWVEKDGDDYPGNTIGVRDENEIAIISVDVESDDTFQVTVNVSLPPFVKGAGNLINAIDGEQPTPNTFKADMKAQLPQFKVDDSIVISPNSANVGDTVRIQVQDWPTTASISGPLVDELMNYRVNWSQSRRSLMVQRR